MKKSGEFPFFLKKQYSDVIFLCFLPVLELLLNGNQYQIGKSTFPCFHIMYELEGMESKELQKGHVTEDKEGMKFFRISSGKVVFPTGKMLKKPLCTLSK